MAKPRVHEVAKELGVTSKEVLAHLEKIGEPAKSHASSVEEAVAERVRADLGNGATPASPSPAATTRCLNPEEDHAGRLTENSGSRQGCQD